MLNTFLPRQVDNTYRGHKLALWLFGAVVLLKIGIGVNSIIDGYGVATTADGIALATFTPAGAQAVVSMFANWGIGQLAICFVGILALVRYRGLIPLMFALLLVEQLSRRLAHHYIPVVTTGSPPGSIVNTVLLVAMVVGLGLSLWNQGKPAHANREVRSANP